MRTNPCTFLFLSLSLAAAGCEFDEGINVHDVSGTITVPKSIAPEAQDIGMIYIGLYSGVDQRLGYTSPIAAPAASTAGADAFPYGGTSIGSFMTRDVREVCSVISERDIRDEGSSWELDFEILQFPFHEGTAAWAWMDTLGTGNPYTSCDRGNGWYGYFQIEVTPIEVTQAGTQWKVVFDDTGLPFPETIPGGAGQRRLLDADGQYWQVTGYDEIEPSVTVFDIYDNGGRPGMSGPAQPALISEEQLQYYGSHFQDVLNFPGKYIFPGDVVTDEAFVLENLPDRIELTLDTEVP